MAAVKLGTKSVGTIVKIKENNAFVDFIVLAHNYPQTGTLLLRKDALNKRTFYANHKDPYSSSVINDYLNNEYYPTIQSDVRAKIIKASIEICKGWGQDVTMSVVTFQTYVFLLSAKEMGVRTTYMDRFPGTKIAYFDSDEKRIAEYSGEPVDWGSRDTYKSYTSGDYIIYGVSKTGGARTWDYDTTSYYVRPAFLANSNLYVNDDGSVIDNTPPVISGSNGALGSFGESPPSYKYTVTDAQGGTVSVTEKVDSTVLRKYNVTLGSQNTLTVSADVWRKILNGSHTLTITAKDSQGATATRTQTFTKNVTSCSFVTAEAFPADAMPDRCIVNVQGKFPEGSTLKVEICNNGNDASPTWEDITQNALNNQKYFFTNKTKTASAWGVKLRATLSRGTASGDCYISSLGGNFQ